MNDYERFYAFVNGFDVFSRIFCRNFKKNYEKMIISVIHFLRSQTANAAKSVVLQYPQTVVLGMRLLFS